RALPGRRAGGHADRGRVGFPGRDGTGAGVGGAPGTVAQQPATGAGAGGVISPGFPEGGRASLPRPSNSRDSFTSVASSRFLPPAKREFVSLFARYAPARVGKAAGYPGPLNICRNGWGRR